MGKITCGKFIFAGLLCCITAYAQTGNPEIESVPPRIQMPVPPQQNAPWTHEDDAFSRAIATLFEQGLADPRGLEYREIEIPVEDSWNGLAPINTHGWILPANGKKDRFAIAWNGLIYPVISADALADIREDWAPDNESKMSRYSKSFAQHSEGVSVSYGNPNGLKMALLLRLGETEIVERIRKAHKLDESLYPITESYLGLANDWAWFAFKRAVRSHQRGDDALALSSAQLLTRIQPLIEVEAKRREIAQEDESNPNSPDRKKPYLPFLKQLPDLLADAKRRVNEAKLSRPQSSDNGSVAELIDDLQNVNAPQWDAEIISLKKDKRVRALVARGDAAVEPLLDALENDKRLTRSVSSVGSFSRSHKLISVAAAANAALSDLLRVDFKTTDKKGEPLSRKQMARQIRVYWKGGAISRPQR